MKMKLNKKKILLCCIIALILLILLSAVYYFQFTALGYRASVPYRSSFKKVTDNVYVNTNYSGNIEDAVRLTKDALERDRAFFGEMECTNTTVIIICDDDKLLSKLGGDHDTTTSFFPSKKNYIYVSDEYLNIPIISRVRLLPPNAMIPASKRSKGSFLCRVKSVPGLTQYFSGADAIFLISEESNLFTCFDFMCALLSIRCFTLFQGPPSLLLI